jgi:cystathionine beta-lyase/cystathionine gamma-synthase
VGFGGRSRENRVSVGREDPDDIIGDIDQALAKI